MVLRPIHCELSTQTSLNNSTGPRKYNPTEKMSLTRHFEIPAVRQYSAQPDSKHMRHQAKQNLRRLLLLLLLLLLLVNFPSHIAATNEVGSGRFLNVRHV